MTSDMPGGELQITDLLTMEADELMDRMLEPATMQAVYEDTTAIIERDRSPDGLYALVRTAVDTMAQLWGGLETDMPSYDCRKGCSWCCHQVVAATAPEVLWAARHVREQLDEAAQQRLRTRIEANVRETRGVANTERMDRRLACALLDDGACAIYDARPMQCRGGFSEDEGYCRELLENRAETQAAVASGEMDGKYLLVPKMLYDSAQVGMAGALKCDGMNMDALDFAAALDIALGDPEIDWKWLKGWPVFAPARLNRDADTKTDGSASTAQPAPGA
jgi:Fe-S-cluster containining protein